MENQVVSELIQVIQFLRKEVSELKSITLEKNEMVEVEVELPVIEKPALTPEQLELKTSLILTSFNIPKQLCGYLFLKEAILLVAMDFDLRQGITKVLYPTIARKFNSTPSKVERGMRHAIESSWYKSHKPFIQTFGHDKPTNSQFVAVIADKIRMEEKIS
jgi:two-component system, response regulator, stage 0 sporulation protein A